MENCKRLNVKVDTMNTKLVKTKNLVLKTPVKKSQKIDLSYNNQVRLKYYSNKKIDACLRGSPGSIEKENGVKMILRKMMHHNMSKL